jgi:predicted DNA-binding transcriptional regulator YafY
MRTPPQDKPRALRPEQTLFDVVEAQTQPAKLCVKLVYTNHRGETAERSVLPIKMWFGNTAWHGADQWLLEAHDVEKGETRSFAVRDIVRWMSC